MPYFDSAGVRIHFRDEGAGEPVILVHGFASTAEHNWGGTGWIEALSPRFRVIAPDVRGHGLSDKPHQPEAYG
ncbi:MAG TPA: alpha/beta fold hydrolase, partial [Patescibacteria group bacterium]|nr:alpha/beta fold hydrolase [Patescibacteria group bacterium]